MERLIGVPVLGEIFSMVMMIAVVVAMMAGFIFYMPIMAICDAVKSFGSPETQRKFDKTFNAIFNPVVLLFLAYGLGYFTGKFFFTRDPIMGYWATGIIWVVITLYALDELYSIVRWHFVSKKIAEEMDLAIYR